MKPLFSFIVISILSGDFVFCQQIKFNHVLGNGINADPFLSIAQDKYGFMWFTRRSGGLQRYDGKNLKSYKNDPNNSNSLASNYGECLVIDSDDIFWIGTYGSGLDRFDQSSNTFTHFRHNDHDNSTLSNDTITALLSERSGKLWVGTLGGLNLLDKKTGKFVHFVNRPGDSGSLSHNDVRTIYEDRSGILWIGCGRPFINLFQKPEDGGLNRFDRQTGKFVRYMHDSRDPNSIASNKVRAIFEDSKGNFWIGTRDDGLQIMDRKRGVFTHYYYDPSHPEKLSRPPQIMNNGTSIDHIAFITEDINGSILIGTYIQGINYYNPSLGKVIHYGYIFGEKGIIAADTSSGLTNNQIWRCFTSREGINWIATLAGDVFTINPFENIIPYYSLDETKPDANSLYCEPEGNVIWVGTDKGLFRRTLKTHEQKKWVHEVHNINSPGNDTINSIKVDMQGKLWLATANGLCKFDPLTGAFTTWRHDDKNSASLSSNFLNYLFIDHEKNIWIGTATTGVDKLDTKTGVFTNYRHLITDRTSISENNIYGICEDHNNTMWIATNYGLNALNKHNNKIDHYLQNLPVSSVYCDSQGIVWAATAISVFKFNNVNKNFQPFTDVNLNEEILKVINIIEDHKQNLWLSTYNSIIRINRTRDSIKIFNESNGVHLNNFSFADNFIGSNGQVFLGDENGFYAFFPDDLKDKNPSPSISFTNFKIGNVNVLPGKNSPLKNPIWEAKKINLNYNQNNFSFEFAAVSYTSPGEKKFLFKLEPYNDEWNYTGTESKAYFFNIPPGNYTLRVRSISPDGSLAEKTISVHIAPPWWRTWWAYTLFGFLFVLSIWSIIYYRSRQLHKKNRILEEKVAYRTSQLNQSLEDLKATQKQLIQSEKMASLGELTAGIAHEIQNPLNFVNNFSEVNNELVDELKSELAVGNTQSAADIADNIKDNQEKINYHGKRADAIVKGMLQHSRTSTGQKELTDINKLTDEYLRLAYHGLRAKDKSFNTEIKTDFDSSTGRINIVPQDIGRVVLNLINNAFYAIGEKKKQIGDGYEPTVTVSTASIQPPLGGRSIQIKVADNGGGIPQKILDKIFHPFFTTKPTGQGTGLGLSLAYDIIKAHGGEIKVETKEGEGSEFVIQLPMTS